MKKAIISGIVFSSILLVGCNGTTEVLESEQEVVVSQKTRKMMEYQIYYLN